MGKNNKNNKKKQTNFPFVSICTPTFNRRPFIPCMLKCFDHQDYPKDKIEWIIIDDGTDKIEDLVKDISQVKYYKFDEKMTLGKKRNIAHEKCSGDIIVYMDDDDYYPPERISHAVKILRENPKALCAGSSEMYIYFKHIQEMYKFGPYGPNHSTAATFAFRKELLKQTSFDNNASIAEEKHFLKNYTIPFVQLDSMKSILVFSHDHNSFDKKDLLLTPNPTVNISDKKVDDFVKNQEIKKFFLEDIDELLKNYELGRPENKPDVSKQIQEIKERREEMIRTEKKKIEDYNNSVAQLNQQHNGAKITELTLLVKELTIENNLLNDKVKYLENKIKELLSLELERKKQPFLSTSN
jgi:glycosyltransferase involved in cell wall biosynthesis